MDLLTRVKTLLGSKTQDNEGWIRQGKLAPAKNLQDVAAGVSKYFNPTSNNGNNFWSSPVAKGLASVQRATPKPVQQFSQGFGNTSTYGLVDFKPQDKPTTAYRVGQAAGFINPLNPLNKGMAALNVGGRVISRVAPKIVGTTAGKIAGGVLSEAAQTGVYTAAQLAAQKAGLQEKRPINIAQNLATGIGLRGAFNQAPNVLRAMIRNKRLPQIDPADQKVMEEFINYARLGKKGKPSLKLEEYASTIAEQYNLPMPKTKAGLADVFDEYLSRIRQQQQEFKSLGLPQMNFASSDRNKLKQVVDNNVKFNDFTNPTPEELKRSSETVEALYNGLLKSTKDKDFLNKAKALRARLNEQQFKLVGADAGDYKTNYAVLQSIKGTNVPQSQLLDQIEKRISDLDEIIANKGKIPVSTKGVGGEEVDILPPDIPVYQEAKAVGMKRISPDRVLHQKLTPDEGISALVSQQKGRVEKISNSWRLASEKIDNIIKKYGDNLPPRTSDNLTKYPELSKDYSEIYDYRKYAPGAKTLTQIRDTFKNRSEMSSLKWTPEAETKAFESAKKDYIELVKKDISHGYRYPDTVLNYDPSFRKAMDSRARYEKGLYTSFSADDHRIVFDDTGNIVAGMKRQDGKELLPAQKREIVNGVLQTQNSLGIDLNQMSKDDRWVYVHLNGKNPFLTQQAAGLYRPGDKSVSISLGGTEIFKTLENGKEVTKRVNTTIAHELGHALDYKVKNNLIDPSTLFDLKRSYKPVEWGFRGEKYWRSSTEVTARALEEYVAVKEGNTKLFDRDGYWSKEIFESKIKPAIESAIDRHFPQYKTTSTKPLLESPLPPSKGVGGEGVNPLIEEAKKYNNVDEFLKAKIYPKFETNGRVVGKQEYTDFLRNKKGVVIEASDPVLKKFSFGNTNEERETLRALGSYNLDVRKDIPEGDIFTRIGGSYGDNIRYNVEEIVKAKKEDYFTDIWNQANTSKISSVAGEQVGMSQKPVVLPKSTIQQSVDKTLEPIISPNLSPSKGVGGEGVTKAEFPDNTNNPLYRKMMDVRHELMKKVGEIPKTSKTDADIPPKLLSELNNLKKQHEIVSKEWQNVYLSPSKGVEYGSNLKLSDAYGKDFLGYNIPNLEKVAKEKNYNLYDALLKRVDSQDNMNSKLRGMQSIMDDLFPSKGVGTKTVRVSAPLKTQPSSTPQGQPIKIKQTPTLKVLKTAPPSNASSSTDILPERGFVTTVKEAKQTVRPVREGIEGTYTPITNKETLTTAQKVVADNYDAAKARVTNEPLTAETNTIAQELMRRAQKEGRYEEAIDIAETIAKKGTEAGQAIQAFSIWQRLTPEGMLKYATREIQKANENAGFLTKVFRKGEAKLSKEGAEFITTQMKKVQALPEGAERDALIKSVMERINQEIPIGASELFDAYRYQNLLSSPRTQLRNAYQNAYQALINRPLTMASEAGVDWVQSTLKGKERTKYLSEVPQYYKGLWNSRVEAANGFMNVWRGKSDFTNPDISQLRNKNLPKGLTVVSRLMEGADKYFQTLIGGGQYAALKKRGLSDEAARKGAEEIAQYSLLRNLPDPKNKTGQGTLLSAIDNATLGVTELGRRLPALRWFVPFIRTPMNAAKQWIEYSPAGVLAMAGNKDKSSQLAKSLIGTAVVGFGANLALQDRTTWSAPTDAKEKELFYASGKKPYSVLIGDKWVPMVYLGPQSLALAIPAAFKQYQQDSRTALTDSQIEKATKSLTSLMGFFSEQTFLSGLGSFVRAVSGDADYTYAGNISGAIGQIIPLSSLTRYVAQIIDPVFRKTGGSTVTEQITNQLKSQIPFATKTLEPYVTPTGELSKRNITDYMAPYSLGTEQPQYDQLLEERRDKLQQNAVLNKAKKDLKDGSQVVGNTVIYKENGETKSFTINSRPQFPTLTGQPELDKKLKSKYNSQLTAYKNDILKLYELGKISAKEAEELIGTVTTKKSGSGGSKKKVSFKVAKSSTVKITKSKAPNFGSLKTSSIKVVKRPNLKFSTPKKVVVAPPKSSQTIKIKALPTLKVAKGGSLT